MNLRNTLLTSAFTEQDPSGRGMSNDMATDGLPTICSSKQRTSAGIRLDLVGHEDGDVELLRHMLDTTEMHTQFLLALIQLAAAEIVNTE